MTSQSMSGRKRLFGTDGVRGTANTLPMTAGMAMRIGQFFFFIFLGCNEIYTTWA